MPSLKDVFKKPVAVKKPVMKKRLPAMPKMPKMTALAMVMKPKGKMK